ncbi:pyrimidine dimer DNA glycosylase/endonuclease V [Candidatus Margulisiibacteriota bacterium]
MRLWTIHPKYLDQKGLVALWREGLLAQKVLAGRTKGYRRHPQIIRFKECSDPMAAIGRYLLAVQEEASKRGYRFDKKKIKVRRGRCAKLRTTKGQAAYEFHHLLCKLKKRAKPLYCRSKKIKNIRVNPLFRVVRGGVEIWERIKK